MTLAIEPEIVSASRPLMGGTVGVHLRPEADDAGAATRDAGRVLARVAAWADRLTRFDLASDLSVLNGDPRAVVFVRPTLAAALDWGREAEGLTSGIVDIALLDERLAAETATPAADGPFAGWSEDRGSSPASRGWSYDRRPRGAIAGPSGSPTPTWPVTTWPYWSSSPATTDRRPGSAWRPPGRASIAGSAGTASPGTT